MERTAVSLIHNIGTMVSGDIENPILESDSVLIKNGVIEEIGSYDELKSNAIDFDIDIRGMTLCPGLMDAHTHPNIGDWTPVMRSLGWMENALHAGVTTLISQGEQLFPGRPTDPSGVKALAVLAAKVFSNHRPGGVKAHCGALMLEEGLTEDDIRELADEGVWLIGEIGASGLKDLQKILVLVQPAKLYGFKVSVHFGPESLPGMKGLSNEDIYELQPDVICHFNGGPTACSFSEMDKVAENCSSFIELIHNGNPKTLNYAVQLMEKRGELERIILGIDTPTGQGLLPRGIIRLVTQISSLNEIPGAVALCMATGNTAWAYGLNTGTISIGKEADFVVMDAPTGSQGKTALTAIEYGDQPTMGMVMVDGIIITRTMRKALNTSKKVLVNGEEDSRRISDEIFA